ncbi:response regulator [Ekhidna sp. MALMAid0563]|uniref:response regulator n=1 Tax=Ekhidna sp. MALMAid0563 TaxID=3143937 RepID=UPI0032E01A9E
MGLTNDVQIVLVEDSFDDAELTQRSLKNSNFVNEVIWLKDGEQAINYLQGKGEYAKRDTAIKPRLILLDLKLPKLSGLEVLERIKKDKNLHKIPVVVMTSSKENKDLDRCYELGANSYVVKPINFSNFMEVTKEISMYWVLINQIPEE